MLTALRLADAVAHQIGRIALLLALHAAGVRAGWL